MRSSSNIQRVVNPGMRQIPERPNPLGRLREIGNRDYMPMPKVIPGRRQIPEEDFRLAALRRRLSNTQRTYS